MIYDDGVKMDDDMRVEVCPRCGNEVMSTYSEYCKICGLSLYNYCLEKTISDPSGSYQDRIEYHKNDSDTRFCEKCGQPTNYFEEGLLKDWQDAKNIIESNEAEDEAAAAEDNFEIPF
ncbi:hypothetical protein [Clostridium cochlearium]|uniref:hypothetical protein n=1 Tax=Clostridium cochlearium TaxID=1494 RepID=UPI00241C9F03|nr:hypothetical protein [Clostridium cochlearium]MBE6065449.1 hypothetical protein [Clostridium cochlearium]